MSVVFFVFMFFWHVLSDTITCPTLKCSSVVDTSGNCYIHDNQQPTKILQSYPCDTGTMWGADIDSGQFAWFSEDNQAKTTGTTGQSNVEQVKVIGTWTSLDLFSQALNNGRDWTMNSQCVSVKWTNGVWVGLASGSVWNTHSDWDANLYCKLGTSWPYQSVCSALLPINQIWYDDYSCQASFFCWYATSSDKSSGIKRWIERYAKPDNYNFGWSTTLDSTITDQEYNGIHCSSGLAYNSATNQATWITAANITFNGAAISNPYPWTPTDNTKKCLINYGSGGSDYISVTWACSLNGQGGYCKKIPGTAQYAIMADKRKRAYLDYKWHTLDRNNYLVYKDTCGNMKDFSTWYTMYILKIRLNIKWN